jgi:RimJ/RimL family protein N-acetyltransferase
LFGLRITCRVVALRLARESDLGHLADILPDDDDHDPRAQMFEWLSLRGNRERLVHQEYWPSLGTWSPTSWDLTMAVEYQDAVVGVQSLEAEEFPTLRTVDSGSWLVRSVRERGIGVTMRMAVLGLAFDHLGAVAAVTSAEPDNVASLGVSRRNRLRRQRQRRQPHRLRPWNHRTHAPAADRRPAAGVRPRHAGDRDRARSLPTVVRNRLRHRERG